MSDDKKPAPVVKRRKAPPAPAEPAAEESFAEMFAASEKARPRPRALRVGEKLTGTVFQIGADTAFLTLGSRKSEAMLDLAEVRAPDGTLLLQPGDELEVYVVQTGASGVKVSRGLGRAGSAGAAALLASARQSGAPVEGLVTGVNKGGLEVTISGARAFCPVSQIDLAFVADPAAFVGQKLWFRVTELRKKDVVLSRKALLAEEAERKATETRKSLVEGARLRGKVTSLRDFGAFVDLGGIEGLLPVSELSHGRVGKPSDVLAQGQEVEVQVLRVEPGEPGAADKARRRDRITLSLKSLEQDPWDAAAATIHEGARLQGRVARLQPFGAFVVLMPGVDGLIHVSALGRRVRRPEEVLRVGQEIGVLVESIDLGARRIALRLAETEEPDDKAGAREPPQPRPPPGKGFGTLGDLLAAKGKKL